MRKVKLWDNNPLQTVSIITVWYNGISPFSVSEERVGNITNYGITDKRPKPLWVGQTCKHYLVDNVNYILIGEYNEDRWV